MTDVALGSLTVESAILTGMTVLVARPNPVDPTKQTFDRLAITALAGAPGAPGAAGAAGATGPAGPVSTTLPVDHTLTASGTISKDDRYVILDTAATSVFTLPNGTVADHLLTIKRAGAGSITVTGNFDGVSGTSLTLANPVRGETIHLAWNTGRATWVVLGVYSAPIPANTLGTAVLSDGLFLTLTDGSGNTTKTTVGALRSYFANAGQIVNATAATAPTPAPVNAQVGQLISGVTTTLTPNGSTAYAVLHDGTAEVGARMAFVGTQFPSVTPATANTLHTLRVYGVPTGGSALASSTTFTVTSNTPTLTTSNVTGFTPGGTSTVNGTFAHGAPALLTALNNGQALALATQTVTTTSGTGPNAVGTFVATFVTPAAGPQSVVIVGSGTYSSTTAAYAFNTVAATGGTTTIISPAFYVSPTGSDAAAGTSAAPFLTFGAAQAAMRASSTVKTTYIRSGTYNFTTPFKTGQQDNGCSYLGYPGETAIIDGGGTVIGPITLEFNTNGVTIDNLTVRNASFSGIYLHGGSGVPVQNCTVSNCTVYNITLPNFSNGAGRSGGIWLDNVCNNNTIKNNYVYDTNCCAITLCCGFLPENMDGNKILFNKIQRANNSGQTDCGGIYFLGRSHTQSGVVIQGNLVDDVAIIVGTPGAGGDNTKAIYLDDEVSGVLVRDNIITGKMSMGLQIHGGDNNTWTNNIFDLKQALLLALYQEDAENGSFGMGNNLFNKNIVVSNAVYNGNVGEAGQPGLWTVLPGSVVIAKPVVTNNVYWNSSGTQFPNANDVIDPNPHVIDPHFTNIATKDYSFTDGGAAVSAACGFVPFDLSLIGPRTQSAGTPAAVLSGVSTTSTQDGNVVGSVALTFISTAYVCLYTGGADEGTRVPTSGGTLPILHPAATGTYTLKVYTQQTGGTLLATSPSITVGAAVAGATLSNVSTSAVTGGTVFGNVSLSHITTAYAGLYKTGTLEGSRIAFTGASLPALSPASTGSYTVRIYDASTAGTLLAESPTLTVSAPGALISPAFYVSPTGADTNIGSSSAPFKTMVAARNAMRASSTKTTYVRAGTYFYTAQFTMSGLDTGTSWLAYPGERPIHDGSGTVSELWWLDYHTNNVTISGMTFQTAITSAIHLNGYKVAGDDGTITGVVISNNIIQNITGNGQYGAGQNAGIRMTFACLNCTISNNLIQNTAGPGIALACGGVGESIIGTKILRNKFLNTNNTGQNDTGAVYGLDRGHYGDPLNPTVIDYNFIQNTGNGVETKLIYLDDEMSAVTITNNICCGKADYGLQLHGSDHVIIRNNIFDMSECDRLLCLYQDATGSGFTNYGMANNSFSGNIVYAGTTGYSQNQMWQYLNQSGGTLVKPTVSNNLYFTLSSTPFPNTYDIIDTSPQVANPLFTNAAAHDYSFTGSGGYSLISFTPINQALIGPQ